MQAYGSCEYIQPLQNMNDSKGSVAPAESILDVRLKWMQMLDAIVRRPLVASDAPPVLVLLHGLGADEQDLMGLAPHLDPKLLIVTFRAPLEYGPTGYAWFQIEWTESGIQVDSEQVMASCNYLAEAIRLLPESLGVPVGPILLGGFSQGAIMTLGTCLWHPELVKAAVLMSGRLVPEMLPAEPAKELAAIPFLIQHGVSDQVLPASGSRAIAEYLSGLGCEVDHREYPMGHEISLESLTDVRNWLQNHL